MINHISIAVHNPEKIANVLAELWNGFVIPFPPAPNFLWCSPMTAKVRQLRLRRLIRF